MGPPLPVDGPARVLGNLVGQALERGLLVEGGKDLADASAPTTEGVDVGGQGEPVGADPADVAGSLGPSLAGARVLVGQHERGGQEGGLDLGGPDLGGDVGDQLGQPHRIGGGATYDGLGVVPGELLLGGVVGAALGAKDEESLGPLPEARLEGVASGSVADHLVLLAGDGTALGGALRTGLRLTTTTDGLSDASTTLHVDLLLRGDKGWRVERLGLSGQKVGPSGLEPETTCSHAITISRSAQRVGK